MRIFARCDLSAGGHTNTVSDRLNSRAIACIAAVSRPSGSSTTARGLPARGLSVKTSRVAKRRDIRGWYDRCDGSDLPYPLAVRQTIIIVVAVLAAAAGGYSQAPAPAGPVALRFGTVVTGLGKSIKDGVIVVEN